MLTPENRTFLFRLACVWLAAMSLLWYAKQPAPTSERQAVAEAGRADSAAFIESGATVAPEIQTAAPSAIVYITRTGSRYHRSSCPHLRSRIPIPLAEAAARYGPCSVCNPPVP